MFLFDTTLLTLTEVGGLIKLTKDDAIKNWLITHKVLPVVRGKRNFYPKVTIQIILEVELLESFRLANPNDWIKLYMESSEDKFFANAVLTKMSQMNGDIIKPVVDDAYSSHIDEMIYGKKI